jgi:site-specific recombinase XerD
MFTTLKNDVSSFQGSISAFLRALEGENKSPATIKAYQADLLQFHIYVQQNNITATTPASVTRSDVSEYLSWLGRRGVTGVSRARKLAALREWFRYLEAHEVCAKAPTNGIETPRKEKNARAYLQSDEYNRLLSQAGANARDYAIVQVFLQTGVRVSELVNLTLEDVDLKVKMLHVRAGKGMVARSIELNSKAITAIKNYLATRPPMSLPQLFLNRYGEPITERGVRKLVVKYRERAGITKKASCHALRHTFATAKAEKGVSPYQLQQWLGHASLNTTQIYVHLSRQNGQKVMEQTSL